MIKSNLILEKFMPQQVNFLRYCGVRVVLSSASRRARIGATIRGRALCTEE